MKVHYRSRALFDLEEVFQYSHKHSPSDARNVINAIHDAITKIAAYPLSAESTPDPAIRVKIVRKYHIKFSIRSVSTDSTFCTCAMAFAALGLLKSKRWGPNQKPANRRCSVKMRSNRCRRSGDEGGALPLKA